MAEVLITIDHGGRMQFVYSDDARELLTLGAAHIERASHVEPTGDCRWTADLSPIGGGMLGPFDSREEALTAEVNAVNEWMG